MLALIPDPVVVSVSQALAFAANAVVVGDVVLGSGLDLELSEIVARGLHIEHLDLSQFHLSGGSVRCLTNPLDIVLD